MDTLKRVGSLRLSKRGRSKKSTPLDNNGTQQQPQPPTSEAVGTLNPNYLSLSRPKGGKAFFTISFKDVVVNTNSGYQPTHLKAIFERRRKSRASDAVLWEPSLKNTSTGSGVWHPPFVVNLAITVPKMKTKASGTLLRHKDAYISIENYDIKGKKKLLAKARLNLSDYFESAAETDVSFRLKLHPESSKIASASIDLTLRKSVHDPTKLNDNAVLDFEDDARSLENDRLLVPSSHPSLSSTPRGSLGDLLKDHEQKSPGKEKKEDEVLDDEDDVNDELAVKKSEVLEEKPKVAAATFAASAAAPIPDESPVVTNKEIAAGNVTKCFVPNIVTPPPLPPRQRLVSQDSPPSSQEVLDTESNIVTSTPLPKTSSVEERRNTLHLPLNAEKQKGAVPFQTQAKSGGTITQRIKTPSPVTLNWDDDDNDKNGNKDNAANDRGKKAKLLESEPPTNLLSLSTTCASPKVKKPNNKLKSSATGEQDQDIIDWAKKTLSGRPQVKVTNLTSSWRNGLGFCAILHRSYPNLIPYEDLASKSDNSVDNNELALDAADLLGVDTQAMRSMKPPPKADIVSRFLQDLRSRLGDDGNNVQKDQLDAEAVIEFQKKWYSRGKYFKREVGHLVKSEKSLQPNDELELLRIVSVEEEETSKEETVVANDDGAVSPQEAADVVTPQPQEHDDNDEEAQSMKEGISSSSPVKSTTSSDPIKSKSSTPTRARVKDLIAQAHDSSSYEEATSTPSSVSEAVPGVAEPLCESVTILEELSQLNREEEEISEAIKKLEEALREKNKEDDCDELEFETMMQKYASLVNQKNSMVRRQMQLNLAEKERKIEHKKERLQRQLQKFSDLDDSLKTEAMRLEEEMLLSQYVEAVNAKNELVHDLHSQEMLIAEDERIKSFVADPNQILTRSGQAKHNILDEFFDFFKKS